MATPRRLLDDQNRDPRKPKFSQQQTQDQQSDRNLFTLSSANQPYSSASQLWRQKTPNSRAVIFEEFSGEEFSNFTKLADKLRADFNFEHTTDAGLLKRGDASVEKPTIRVLKPFDELHIDFQSFDLDVMEKFIRESTVPSLVVFDGNPSNQGYAMDMFNSEDAKVMLFLNFSSEEFGLLKSKFQDIAVLLIELECAVLNSGY